ncbi:MULTISPECIES: hypothetical protein [unclassified Bradyrhizobium]|jgi:hypothetical protein|nr:MULTISPECIES: hypothetical protein [unclassified Bradyrhizobium]
MLDTLSLAPHRGRLDLHQGELIYVKRLAILWLSNRPDEAAGVLTRRTSD